MNANCFKKNYLPINIGLELLLDSRCQTYFLTKFSSIYFMGSISIKSLITGQQITIWLNITWTHYRNITKCWNNNLETRSRSTHTLVLPSMLYRLNICIVNLYTLPNTHANIQTIIFHIYAIQSTNPLSIWICKKRDSWWPIAQIHIIDMSTVVVI